MVLPWGARMMSRTAGNTLVERTSRRSYLIDKARCTVWAHSLIPCPMSCWQQVVQQCLVRKKHDFPLVDKFMELPYRCHVACRSTMACRGRSFPRLRTLRASSAPCWCHCQTCKRCLQTWTRKEDADYPWTLWTTPLKAVFLFVWIGGFPKICDQWHRV